ncbi:hypothetical protein N7G274_005207 [Stereocaulon virgatum]|uniref:Uncharacterized protein n=1 Tax=Stereocaulon virgatum TaxID=373712 RepID=A0ABR4ABD0_9LECA
MESDRRQKAESEAGHLKVTVRQLHVDNEKLEKHISEWKSMAEESEGRAAKYSKEMGKIYATLEGIKSELPRAEYHPESTYSQIGKYDTTYLQNPTFVASDV